MDDDSKYPGIGHATVLTIALIAVQLVMSIVVVIAFIIVGRDFSATDPLMISIGNVVAFSAALLWVRLWGRRTFRELIPLRSFRPIILVPLVPLLPGLGIAASEADNILRYFLPVPEFIDRLYEGLRSGGIASIIALAVVAPFTHHGGHRTMLSSSPIPCSCGGSWGTCSRMHSRRLPRARPCRFHAPQTKAR